MLQQVRYTVERYCKCRLRGSTLIGSLHGFHWLLEYNVVFSKNHIVQTQDQSVQICGNQAFYIDFKSKDPRENRADHQISLNINCYECVYIPNGPLTILTPCGRFRHNYPITVAVHSSYEIFFHLDFPLDLQCFGVFR